MTHHGVELVQRSNHVLQVFVGHAHVGSQLLDVLVLMFDVETVFLYPWAVKMADFGAAGLISIAFFFGVLVLGLVYAWRKGALEWK